MRRRKHQSAPPGPATQGFQYRPFRHLTRRPIGSLPEGVPAAREPAAVEPLPEVSDAELFEREMAGVRPLTPLSRRVTPPPTRPLIPTIPDADAEVLAELSDLVSGSSHFDISNTMEFIEGAVVGLDRRVLRRLRAGEFACQSHLDLHGLTAGEARPVVDRFLTRATRRGHRCVLIIHGRGLNSKDQVPVLKKRLASWLARGSWARLVLAFATARPCDGGAGALYVLLRRRREGKRSIRVTVGAGR